MTASPTTESAAAASLPAAVRPNGIRSTWQGRTAALAGGLALLLGLMVVLGWHVHSATLVQLRSSFTPMVYNTALCFTACGAALLAAARGHRGLALPLGGLVLATGALSALQYILDVDLCIDSLLMEPYISVGSSTPGRMAPNTAMCFVLAGAALVLMSRARSRRWMNLVAGLLAAAILAVAANGLSGYFTGIKIAYGWAPLVPMAFHSAVGFVALGTGLIAWTWFEGAQEGEVFPRWFPILVGVGVLTLTMGQWQTAVVQGRTGSALPTVVLCSGVLTAFLLAMTVHLAQKARARVRETVAVNLSLQGEAGERRLAEAALRASEERLARIVETIADGVFIIENDGSISFANKRGEEIVGLPRSEITRRSHDSPAWQLLTVDGKPLPNEDLPISRAVKTGAPVYDVELSLHRPDGQRVTVSVNAAPMRDPEGAIAGVVASVSDITRRKEVENLKDTLVSTVSHELRTPLSSLRGFAELMLKRDYPPEKRREFLTIIHSESVRLTRLINDFLDIQRIETGHQYYDFRALDLSELLSSTRSLFAAEDERQRLLLSSPSDLPLVRADADRMRQVLCNLVSNALKFSPADSEVLLAARREGEEVLLSVTDQGIGIAAAELPHLFARFYRVEGEETRNIRGTGLGLALVKEIVAAHDGRVWVESRPGVGSTFFVSLPLAGPEEADGIPALPDRPDVLLVEDDQSFARLLAEQFSAEGLALSITGTGEEALGSLRRCAPRLAILDINLGGRTDGWDVLIAAKGDPVLRSVPIAILSGSNSINGRGLALAGCEYVIKPVSSDWLLDTVRGQLTSLSGKSVLLVDDDEPYRRAVCECLAAEGVVVEEAADGNAALACIARRMPDLLMLDLMLPGLDGLSLVGLLRQDRRAVNLPVLVVTGKHLTLEDKTFLRRRLATFVKKGEASLDAIVRTARQLLGPDGDADRRAA